MSARAFDYSDAEWRAIEEAAAAVGAGPLTTFERNRLRAAANQYRVCITGVAWLNSYKADKVRLWGAVETLAGELKVALAVAIARTHTGYCTKQLKVTLPATLGRLVQYARIFSTSRDKKTTKQEVREDYYAAVLLVWTKRGGKLGVTRDTATNKVKATALIRFFQSAAAPVLGKDVPSIESFPHIVKREKHRRGGISGQ